MLFISSLESNMDIESSIVKHPVHVAHEPNIDVGSSIVKHPVHGAHEPNIDIESSIGKHPVHGALESNMHMEAEHLYPTRILDPVLKPLISIKLLSDYSLQCSVFIVPSLVNIYKRQQSILYIIQENGGKGM